MNIVGLVAEYNPFHNGHLYHLNKAKEITSSDFVVVVMSGNYVQRGEPAFCDKYLRTQMALLNGASLVIELPVVYATSSAEYFARASVGILEKTGIVNSLCFGSECGSIKILEEVSDILLTESPTYIKYLKKYLDEGLSFPVARAKAISFFDFKHADILNNPNNILGIEYLKSIKLLNSKITPYTIKREISLYNSKNIDNEISSATAIRHFANKNDIDIISKTMPISAYNIFTQNIVSGNCPVFYDNFSHILHYIIKTSTSEQLKGILDVTEGLENRIIKCSDEQFLISDIIEKIKTKRYTYTKIQRAILHILLNIKKNDFDNFNNNLGPQYVRVLGFRREHQFLLRMMEQNSKLPIITNLKNSHKNLSSLGVSMLKKEIESTDLYYIGLSSVNKIYPKKNVEYSKALVIL